MPFTCADPENSVRGGGPYPGGGGGGGTLIFSYIRRLGSFFVVKILNFNIFGGFPKNKYFLGCDDFVDISWVITKLDYI